MPLGDFFSDVDHLVKYISKPVRWLFGWSLSCIVSFQNPASPTYIKEMLRHGSVAAVAPTLMQLLSNLLFKLKRH